MENAIFHGIEPKGCAGHIRIHVGYETSDNTEKIRIDVTDDGVGMTADKAAQVLRSNDDSSADFFREIGVSNVHKRLQYQFGAEYGITIESKEGEYTTMSYTYRIFLCITMKLFHPKLFHLKTLNPDRKLSRTELLCISF